MAANQIFNAGLLNPTLGLVRFHLKFRDRLDRITGDANFGIVSGEFFGSAFGAGENAIAFFIEARRNGFDGVSEKLVVLDVESFDAEAGFDGLELCKHGAKSS